MQLETFKILIDQLKEASENDHKFYQLGLDMQCVSDKYHLIIDLLLRAHYGEQGGEWISWFLYERRDDRETPQAWDEAGNEICYDVESLWNYIEEVRKSSEFKEYIPPPKMSDEERLKIIKDLFSKPQSDEL
jgi:hypothetical protein